MSFFKEWHEYNHADKDMNVELKKLESLADEIEEHFKDKSSRSLLLYCAELELKLESKM